MIDEMYFVAKGTVIFCLDKRYGEKEIREIKKNNNFGEIEMCLNEKLSFNIKIKSRNCELFVLKKNDFLRLSVNFKEFIESFLHKSLMKYLKFQDEKNQMIKEFDSLINGEDGDEEDDEDEEEEEDDEDEENEEGEKALESIDEVGGSSSEGASNEEKEEPNDNKKKDENSHKNSKEEGHKNTKVNKDKISENESNEENSDKNKSDSSGSSSSSSSMSKTKEIQDNNDDDKDNNDDKKSDGESTYRVRDD